jgi:hypothetical protein
MSALERTSSIWRLVQRLTSRRTTSEVSASLRSAIDEHVQRQHNLHSTHSRYDSCLPHLEQTTSQTEHFAVEGQARRCTADGWDISDDLLDDDAFELLVDDTFVAQVIAESELIRTQTGTERKSNFLGGYLPVTSSASTEARTSPKNDISSTPLTLASSQDKDRVSAPDADNTSLSEEMSGHYFLALDAYNHDPVPFEDICPIVIEFAAQQLDEFDWSKLKRRKCMEQLKHDSRTHRWSQDVKHDRFACWTCSMSKDSVCMRWLGGNAFLILPLLPKLRKPGTRTDQLEYWVWGGPT